MKRARALLVFTALAAAGCNLVLGIDGNYTGDLVEDGGPSTDASIHEDGGPDSGVDATVSDAADAAIDAPGTSSSDADAQSIPDSAPVLCPDGAVSPAVAAIDSPCCADNYFACDQGQNLEQLICANGLWAPNGSCTSGNLCRTDFGEYPDSGPENDGSIVGATSGSIGQCTAEISACTGKTAGAVVCSGKTLIVCGDDLTTAYEETCGSAALCAQHTEPHCPQCVNGTFECTGNTPSACMDGGYVQSPACAVGYNCHQNDGTCQQQACSPSSYKCVGDDLQQCDVNGNVYGDAGLCEAGTCDPGGVCDFCVKTANYGCNTGSTGYNVCNATGSGLTAVACSGTTPYCYAANGSNATCVQCLTAGNCPNNPPNSCQVPACGSGSCSYQAVKDGTTSGPIAGQCTYPVCMNGAPKPMNVTDGTVVVMPNGMTCAEQTCTGGVAGPASAPLGTACVYTDGTASTCDSMGNCLQPM